MHNLMNYTIKSKVGTRWKGYFKSILHEGFANHGVAAITCI